MMYVRMVEHVNHCQKMTGISSVPAFLVTLVRGELIKYSLFWSIKPTFFTSTSIFSLILQKNIIKIKRCDRMNMTATSISRIEVMSTFPMRETSSQKPLLSERNTTTSIAILHTEHFPIIEHYNNTDNET